jgi:hypothetical protein
MAPLTPPTPHLQGPQEGGADVAGARNREQQLQVRNDTVALLSSKLHACLSPGAYHAPHPLLIRCSTLCPICTFATNVVGCVKSI